MPSLIDIRFTFDDRLPNRVVQSRRLLDLLPADKMDPLVAAYKSAKKIASEAARVTYAPDDIAAEVHHAITSGADVDVSALMDRRTRQAAERTAHKEAQAFFAALPASYKNEIAQLINGSGSRLWRGLAAQLDDLLDRAESVVASLDGALDPEAAMDAGKAEEWTALRSLVDEHADVRAAHLDLLRSFSDVPLADDIIAHAFFAGISDAWPDIQRTTRFGTHEGGFRVASDEPFPVADPTSREHALAVFLNRSVLRPRIGTVEEAKESRAAALRATPDKSVDLGPPSPAVKARLEGGPGAYSMITGNRLM